MAYLCTAVRPALTVTNCCQKPRPKMAAVLTCLTSLKAASTCIYLWMQLLSGLRALPVRPCLCFFSSTDVSARYFVFFAELRDVLTKFWFKKGFSSYAQKYCQACMICATNSAGKGTSFPQAAHPPPTHPFDHLMMDFIELTPAKGKKYCLVMWTCGLNGLKNSQLNMPKTVL